MKLHRNLGVAVCVLVISLVLGSFVLSTPVVRHDPTGATFSAIRAASHIGVISQRPHSVFDAEAHEEVRQYLKAELAETLGAENVTEHDYTVEDATFGTVPIRNLLAKVPGESETPILVVAHYDSRGHIGRTGELGWSFGAADDGYGLGTMLEIARLYAGKPLENPIWLLFTDGEEIGLHGARMACAEPWMDQVGFVVNLEARGVSGPAYMFETGKKNERVIELYRRANLPVSYSIATAVYSVMPNYTDFTEFVEAGKTGVNFAVLEGLKYYHSPGDQLANIRLSSLQHYGEQVVPLLDAYTSDPRYADPRHFEGAQDQVFFTLLPDVFVHYPESAAMVMDLALLGLVLALVVWLVRRKAVTLRSYGRQLLRVVALLPVWAIAGYGVSAVVAFLGKVPWKVTYVRVEGSELPTLATMALAVAALGWWMARRLPKAEDRRAFLLAGVTVDAVLAALVGFALSGATYVFFVPAAAGFAALVATTLAPGAVGRHVGFGLATLVCLLVAVPLLYSLFIALTVGGLLALMVLLALYAAVLVPSFLLQAAKDARP